MRILLDNRKRWVGIIMWLIYISCMCIMWQGASHPLLYTKRRRCSPGTGNLKNNWLISLLENSIKSSNKMLKLTHQLNSPITYSLEPIRLSPKTHKLYALSSSKTLKSLPTLSSKIVSLWKVVRSNLTTPSTNFVSLKILETL